MKSIIAILLSNACGSTAFTFSASNNVYNIISPFSTKTQSTSGTHLFYLKDETTTPTDYNEDLISTQLTTKIEHPSSSSSKSFLLAKEETVVPLEWIEFFTPDQVEHHTPVLFLHGLLGSKRNFSTLANVMGKVLDKQRRILGVDLRNHGDSLPHSPSMSYPQMAKDVVNFLDSQKIRKIVLVGHSMGGKIAQCIALQYPEYVEGLVVLDIAPVTYSREKDQTWKSVEDILHTMKEITEITAAHSVDNKITKQDIDISLKQKIPDPALRAFILTNFDSNTKRWKIPIPIIVKEIKKIAGFDLSSQLPSSTEEPLTSPSYEGDVFFINGGQSRFIRHAHMDKIASFFPNHMLTTIRGAGHWIHAEAPDDTLALLKKYLDR